MTANPIYQQYMHLTEFAACEPGTALQIDTNDYRLIWIRKGGPVFWYTCQNALGCNAREEDCSTPLFVGKEIPDYVLDWMSQYAKTMQIGAAWYRQNRRQK